MKNLIIIVLLLIGTTINAQVNGTETFHLTNGSLIKGVVVEYVPNISYTVKTDNGSMFIIEVVNIVKVTRSMEETTSKTVRNKTTNSFYRPGYKLIAESGLGLGMGTYGLDVFKLDLIYGKRFDENWFVGPGLALRQPLPSDDYSFISLLVNGRYCLTPKSEITPFVSTSVGVAFNSTDGFNDGGLLVNPAIGINIEKLNNVLLHASLGYDAMQMPFYVLIQDQTQAWLHRKIRFSEAFVFHIGVSF
jgi:hypothetical protein